MEKLYLAIALFFIPHLAKSQIFEKTFLGEDYQFYKGVLFKLDPNREPVNWYTFSTSIEHCINDRHDNFPRPDTSHVSIDSIENKIFELIQIIDPESSSVLLSGRFHDAFFVLKDTKSNFKMYFRYDKKMSFYFPFLTSKIIYDEKILCSRIIGKFDDFTRQYTYNTPFLEYGTPDIVAYKTIKNNIVSYILSLHAHSPSLSLNIRGATILFSDKTSLFKNVKIDVDADSEGYQYSAYIAITKAELDLLLKKKIWKYRLYIYDGEPENKDAELFKTYLKCLTMRN